MTLRKIRLHGELAEAFGEVWNLAVASPAEAIRAIEANKPGFAQHLIESEKRGVGYRVILGERNIGERELGDPYGREILHIVPTLAGAKDGIGQIIVGAALVAASFTGWLPAAGLFGAGTPSIASIAFSVGSGLVLGGAAQMLSPTPETPVATPATLGYYFSGPVNNAKLGDGVPIGYGELIIGAVPISAGLSTENVVPG